MKKLLAPRPQLRDNSSGLNDDGISQEERWIAACSPSTMLITEPRRPSQCRLIRWFEASCGFAIEFETLDLPCAVFRCSYDLPSLLLRRAARSRSPRRYQRARSENGCCWKKASSFAIYPVSTSKFGLGDGRGTCRTPLGQLEVADKIGAGAPPGTVFKDRHRTGEIVAPNSPGRDPIVTRILWLRGLQAGNVHAFAREIYIHGTPEERNLGRPVSYGCIRMRSSDVIHLYDIVGGGTEVSIVDFPLDIGSAQPDRALANPWPSVSGIKSRT